MPADKLAPLVDTITESDNMARIETLARVDERTKSMQADLTQFRADVSNSLHELGEKIKDSENRTKENFQRVEEQLNSFKKDANETFVKKEEFEPIKRIVWAIAGIVASCIVAALMGLILHSNFQIILK